jgi:hypothetical protein
VQGYDFKGPEDQAAAYIRRIVRGKRSDADIAGILQSARQMQGSSMEFRIPGDRKCLWIEACYEADAVRYEILYSRDRPR